MLKIPRSGVVKTRLASETGTSAATSIYRAMIRSLVHRVAAPARWQTWLAVSPDGFSTVTGKHMIGAGRDCGIVPQRGGDLGARMWRQLCRLPGDKIILGSDIIGVDRAGLARAFKALSGAKCVIGPSEDGGYWLLGLGGVRSLRRAVSSCGSGALSGIQWSTPDAMEQTIAALSEHGIGGGKHRLLWKLPDIDTAKDLRLAPQQGRNAVGRFCGANLRV